MAAHDSRPASFPANVACNSPDAVSYRATISLELQRLRTLLKVHSIELHAKLLRARAACVPRRARGSDTSHVSPLIRAWVRHLARESANPRVGPLSRAWVRWYAWGRRPGAYLGVGVRVMGLTRIVSGSRATHQAVAVPTPQVTLPTTPRCQRLLPRWFALWAAPRGVTSPTVNCGTCASRGPVRDLSAGGIAIKWGELHH